MGRYPLIETTRYPISKLDMAPRGPKVFTKIVPVWSREHAEEAKKVREAQEAARRIYGRS